jgi:hypothetical protein
VNKQKRLCRTCYKHRPEYGPTPRKKPTTCEGCKTRGQLHRDSDWLWNMLVTRKPRKKGRKRYKILWSEETLRDQLWWLKPRRFKREVKEEPGVVAMSPANSSPSSRSSSHSSSSSASSAATPRSQLGVAVKFGPGVDNGGGERM